MWNKYYVRIHCIHITVGKIYHEATGEELRMKVKQGSHNKSHDSENMIHVVRLDFFHTI